MHRVQTRFQPIPEKNPDCMEFWRRYMYNDPAVVNLFRKIAWILIFN
jgi:hypothetical protein